MLYIGINLFVADILWVLIRKVLPLVVAVLIEHCHVSSVELIRELIRGKVRFRFLETLKVHYNDMLFLLVEI